MYKYIRKVVRPRMKVTFGRSREIRRRILPFVMSLVMILTINMTVYAADTPTITTQPTSQIVEEGQPAGFSVTAEGTHPLSYQWQKDGIDISGETSAALNIPNVRGADSGSYTVVITDEESNSVTSDAATLTVIRTTVFEGLSQPHGIAVDGSGKIYVADTVNNAVKRMNADGSNIVTLGSGFDSPCGVAVYEEKDSGNIYVYVADSDNNAVKRMDADGSNIVTLGSGFSHPYGIAVDGSGNIYVADSGNNAVKRMDADGSNIVTLGSDFNYPSGITVYEDSGNIYVYVADFGNSAVKRMDADGSNIVTLGPGFRFLYGVAVDGSGYIYVADTDNNAVKRMDADGRNIVTLGSRFNLPTGVAVDSSGNIYVADTNNNAVKRMDADGSNIMAFGMGFKYPYGVAADSGGNIYVADAGNNAVRKIDADSTNIVTLGSGFKSPTGVAVDGSGNIYVADTYSNAVKRMDADGSNIVTLGSGFNTPFGVAVDGSGNIYVADTNNNAVKRMDAEGTNIETLGSGFNRPSGVAVDSSGNIYVADYDNSAIKRMDANGTNIETLGSGFSRSFGVAVDGSGYIYVADTSNNAIKKMDANGSNIVTLGSDFYSPYGVAVDGGGNIYVADTGNNEVKKIQSLYGVVYNSNGSTGGSVPTDGSSYKQGDTVTVAGNIGSLVKTGYIFAGWNTAADGGGTSYGAGSVYIMGAANVTLFAKWIPAHTVSVSASPAAGGNVAGGGIYSEGASVTVTATTNSGYAFVNWTEGGSEVSTGASYTFALGTSDRALMANFTQTPPDIAKGTISGIVTDGTNPVSGATVSLTVSDSVYSATTIVDGSYSILNVPVGTGYTVTAYKAGYNNGSAINVSVIANTATSGINITLSVIPITYTVTYHANSGYNANITTGSGEETNLPVTVNKNTESASIDVSSLGSLLSGGAIITIPSIPDVDTYSVGIPVPYLSTGDVQGALTLNTDAGRITIPSDMLTSVPGISGSKAEITIGQGDKSTLPPNMKATIGDKPLIQLTLSIDGKQTDWNNPNAPVTVSIPYTPTAAELASPESIVVWYIDGSGKTVSVPNGRYDPATGTVTFTTTHFSYYTVSFKQVSFKDVAKEAWYAKAVSFIAAREISTGMGNGYFSPEAKLTRGQFIVMLMKAYGITPDTNPKDNFSDAGSTYYTGYLAAAKRLGISAGVGNNLFAPEKEITRQEMFTLLYNALKAIGKLPGMHGRAVSEADDQPQGNSGKTLSDFTDAGQIDLWAKDAMTLLVKAGTVSGNAGKLTPLSTTSRAEMAQLLYNLLVK